MTISNRTIMAALLGVFLVTGVVGFPGLGEVNAEGKALISSLDYNEVTHLQFMREEEKLARDVYLTLSSYYPTVSAFQSIDDSEQDHTDAVKNMLLKYGQEDPNTDDAIGAFTGEEWGEYFAEKYTQLTNKGREDLLSALYVGAMIEELDMHDIIYCPAVIVEASNGIDDETQCGQVYTDEKPILTLYQNLLNGSANHLKSYVKNIEQIIGAGNYEAQVLSQEEVDMILGR